jgi:hypothetical protein
MLAEITRLREMCLRLVESVRLAPDWCTPGSDVEEEANAAERLANGQDTGSGEPFVPDASSDRTLRFSYTNHRGDRAVCQAIPIDLFFGSTEHHGEPQWIVRAHDLDESAIRDFALRDMIPLNEARAEDIIDGHWDNFLRERWRLAASLDDPDVRKKKHFSTDPDPAVRLRRDNAGVAAQIAEDRNNGASTAARYALAILMRDGIQAALDFAADLEHHER